MCADDWSVRVLVIHVSQQRRCAFQTIIRSFALHGGSDVLPTDLPLSRQACATCATSLMGMFSEWCDA